MAADIQIHLEGFIDFKGIVSDPEKPKEVKVGYRGNRALTPAVVETAYVILTFAGVVATKVSADVLAKVICKHISKEKSKTIVIERETVNVDDEGRITQIIRERITREPKD